jgi:hypothetical protein
VEPQAGGKRTNTLAIISLVGGIASYFGVVCLGALVGIVCGHLARGQIRQTGEDGDSLAIAGMVLGYLHLVLVAIVAAVWLFVLGGMAVLYAIAGAHH